jgi:hypothetical protein
MKRLQIQLDEALYDAVRRRAFEEQASMASVVRDAIAGSIGTPEPRLRTLEDYGFIGAGSSEPPPDGAVSVRHDAYLDEAIFARFRKP